MDVDGSQFGRLSMTSRRGAFLFQLQLWRSMVVGCLELPETTYANRSKDLISQWPHGIQHKNEGVLVYEQV